MEDWKRKIGTYIQLQVSDVPKASLILERQFHVTDYAVQDEHNLRLYDTALDMAAINKALGGRMWLLSAPKSAMIPLRTISSDHGGRGHCLN